MSDTNLDPSISALSTRATEVAASASARELLNLSRIAPSLEQSENAGLEVAINSRAAGLAPSATATELKSIGKAIGNVLEPDTFVAGAFIPAQLDQSGKFLGTSGTSKNWSGVSVSGLSEVNISSIANDETLVYNNVSSQFENSSQVFNIPQYAQTADLPASATSGATAFDASTAELKYWDGSEWKVAAVVAAAGGSTSNVDWQSVNTTFVHRIQALGNTQWGASAAISGDYFCVVDSENGGSYVGTLYIYDTETATLQHSVTGTVSNGQQGVDYEGHGPTAMSGDYIAISSGYHMNQDRVRIIQASTGNVVATITRPSELANGCRFGQSVALNEDCSKLVVGAPRNLSNRGRVYVYDISDKNNLPSADDYTLSLQSYTQNPSYKFGESVAISGNILVTASPGMWEGVGLENRGSVFDATTGDMIPSGVGDSKFVQPSGYTAPFGHSVDVFENGGDFIAAFCEREAIVSGEANAGAVHIYNSSGDLIRTIVTPNASQNEYFGTQAKILSSDTIMISAPTADTGGEFSSFPHRRGRVYFYSITDGSLLATLDNPDDLSSSANHNHYKYFGRSIAADKTTGKILVAQGPGGTSHRAYIFEAPVTQSGGGSGSGSTSSVDWSAGTLSSTVFADGYGDYANLGEDVAITETYYAISSSKGTVTIYNTSDNSLKKEFSLGNQVGYRIALNGSGKLAISNGNASGQIHIYDIEADTTEYINTGAIPYDSISNRTDKGFDFKGKWFAFRDGAVNKSNPHPISGGNVEQGRLYIYDVEAGLTPLYEIDESTIIGALETDGTTAIVDGLGGSSHGEIVIDSTNEILWVSFPTAATTLNGSGMTSGDGWHDRNAGVVVPIDLTTGNVIISKTIPNAQIREGVATTQSQLPNTGDVPIWYDRLYPQDRRQPRGMKWGDTLAVSSTHIAIGATGASTNEWYYQNAGGAIFVYNISGDTPLLEAVIYQAADSSDFDYYRNNATGTGGNTLLLPTRAQDGYFPSSLALNDTQLFIGSVLSGPDLSEQSNNEGAAFVVNLSDYTLAHDIVNPNFTGETNWSYFGKSVDVSGNKLVVGEPYRGQQQFGGGTLITIS